MLNEIENLFARYQKTGNGTRVAFNSNIAQWAAEEDWKTLADYTRIAARFVESCEAEIAAERAMDARYRAERDEAKEQAARARAQGQCSRCLGSGKYGPLQVEGGACFDCRGTGRA